MASSSAPRIPQAPTDFAWRANDLNSAYQFMIDARHYVRNLPVPEGMQYQQIAHSGDPPIGDPKRPALLNASYQYQGRSLVSISMPEFTRMQVDCDDWEKGIRNTGFTGSNLSESLRTIFKSQGIEIERGKFGLSYGEMTSYIEFDLKDPRDFDKAKAIVDAMVRGQANTPEELAQEIKARTQGYSNHQSQDTQRAAPTQDVTAQLSTELKQSLGDNVLSVQKVGQGYLVDVPATFSRSEFAKLGIDPNKLHRSAHSSRQDIDHVLIPEDALPQHMRASSGISMGEPEVKTGKWAKIGKVFGFIGVVGAAVYAGSSKAAEGGSVSEIAEATAANMPVGDVVVPLKDGRVMDAAVAAAGYVPVVGGLTMATRTEAEQQRYDSVQAVIDSLPEDPKQLMAMATDKNISPDLRHLAEGKMMMVEHYYDFTPSGAAAALAGKDIVEKTAKKIFESQPVDGMENALAQAKEAGCTKEQYSCQASDNNNHPPPSQTAQATSAKKSDVGRS